MSQSINIPIFPGSASFSPGITPYGYYDNDTAFQTEAPQVAKWCANRLGYPIVDVELQDAHFFTAFEEAVTEYSSIVNDYNIYDNLLNVQGTPTGSELNNKLVKPSLNRIIEISEEYSMETNLNGRIDLKSGSIDIKNGQQDYDLNVLFRDIEEPGNKIEIRHLYHQAIPASLRQYDSFVGQNELMYNLGFGNQSVGYIYTLTPDSIPLDMLQTQAIELNDKIRRSHYSFRLNNNKLQLFPIPKKDEKLFFEYYVKEDRQQIFDDTVDRITDYSNIPYGNLTYSLINSVGKHWIKRYTLALAKQMLGEVRSKFSTIPIPNSEMSLNGTELIASAQQEQEILRDDLRHQLDKLTRKSQLEKQKDENEFMQSTVEKIPLPFHIF